MLEAGKNIFYHDTGCLSCIIFLLYTDTLLLFILHNMLSHSINRLQLLSMIGLMCCMDRVEYPLY